MKWKCLLAILLMVPTWVSSTDLSPWLTKDFEIQPRASVLFQNYPRIQRPDHDIHHKGSDRFYTLGVAGTFCLPYKDAFLCGLSAELEMTIADTHRQHPGVDNFRLTGRYRILDDVADDDPITLTTGVTVTQAFRNSVHDISSFHHGIIEGEWHIAAGIETPYHEFWKTHTWAVFGVGTADVGSPWLRGDLIWEYNWCDEHQLRLFAHSLWGLGGNNLPRHHFSGYGPINHQSVDLGVRYLHVFENYATLSVEYARRVYAHNFPEAANLVLLSLMYPFSL